MDMTTPLMERTSPRKGLLGVEKIGMIYAALTAVVALLFIGDSATLASLAVTRVAYAAATAAAVALYRARPCRLTMLPRTLLQFAMLAAWYPETYLFCRLFGNLDHVFALADQWLFGFQPALLFSERFSGRLWSELFNLGYFSYYPMIAFLVVWTFLRRPERFEKTAFIVLCSFLIFFTVFLFLPVAGPQFYYCAAGLDDISAGTFHSVGSYFCGNYDMMPPPGDGGLFRSLVAAAQEGGERPTAAFPSSHVGISSIIMILAWKADRRRRVFLALLPFYTLLCFSTVYIRAHYAVDAMAGLAVAYPVYAAARRLYYTRTFHRHRKD